MNESTEQDDRRPDEGSRGRPEKNRHVPRRAGRWTPGGGRRLPAEVAEQLLNGDDTTGDDPRTAELATLLSAARVLPAGRPQDEADALDAFRGAAGAAAAPPVSVPHPVVPARRWRGARRRRPVRILVGGAAAVFTIGGAAFAAQGGGLPSPFHPGGATHGPSASASSPSASRAGTPPGTSRTPGSSPNPAAPRTVPGSPSYTPGSVPPSSGAPADAGTKGLCEAYAKAERDGKAPEGAVLSRLATAAGGVDRIDAYCATPAAVPTPGHGQRSADPHPGASAGPSSAATATSAALGPPAHVTPGVGRHK